MMKKALVCIVALTFLFSTGCSINVFNKKKWQYDEPKISRTTLPTKIYERYTGQMPQYKPGESEAFTVYLMHSDLREEDLSDDKINLEHSCFDTKTQWPDKIPDFFEPRRIMKTAKTPGLKIRDLHEQGITGKKVSIAFINNSFYVDHANYVERIKLYEEIDSPLTSVSELASKYVSVAAGKTSGVAPEMDIFYTYALDGEWTDNGEYIRKYKACTKALNRILEINKTLPRERKIRAIFIYSVLEPKAEGYEEFIKTIQKVMSEGIFITIQGVMDYNIMGLGREPLNDPEDISSYGIPHAMDENWDKIMSGEIKYPLGENVVLFPADSLYSALPSDSMDYAFYSMAAGGEAEAYAVGLYALACQVYPDVTPEIFMKEALNTGEKLEIEKNGKKVIVGKIVNPTKLIDNLKKMNK